MQRTEIYKIYYSVSIKLKAQKIITYTHIYVPGGEICIEIYYQHQPNRHPQYNTNFIYKLIKKYSAIPGLFKSFIAMYLQLFFIYLCFQYTDVIFIRSNSCRLHLLVLVTCVRVQFFVILQKHVLKTHKTHGCRLISLI